MSEGSRLPLHINLPLAPFSVLLKVLARETGVPAAQPTPLKAALHVPQRVQGRSSFRAFDLVISSPVLSSNPEPALHPTYTTVRRVVSYAFAHSLCQPQVGCRPLHRPAPSLQPEWEGTGVCKAQAAWLFPAIFYPSEASEGSQKREL